MAVPWRCLVIVDILALFFAMCTLWLLFTALSAEHEGFPEGNHQMPHDFDTEIVENNF